MASLRVMKLIQKVELDFRAIEEMVRQDVSLTLSLLKYINSAAFHWIDRIGSVRQALLLLGPIEIRKWAVMASLSAMGDRRPRVLIAQALIRGRFCESIAGLAGQQAGSADPFMLGMFSLLDAILQRPLAAVLEDLNISQRICDVLLGTASVGDQFFTILRLVKAYEIGDWEAVEACAKAVSVPVPAVNSSYLETLSWVEEIAAPQGAPGHSLPDSHQAVGGLGRSGGHRQAVRM